MAQKKNKLSVRQWARYWWLALIIVGAAFAWGVLNYRRSSDVSNNYVADILVATSPRVVEVEAIDLTRLVISELVTKPVIGDEPCTVTSFGERNIITYRVVCQNGSAVRAEDAANQLPQVLENQLNEIYGASAARVVAINQPESDDTMARRSLLTIIFPTLTGIVIAAIVIFIVESLRKSQK